MSIPITKQRNAFPGDRTVVFQAPPPTWTAENGRPARN